MVLDCRHVFTEACIYIHTCICVCYVYMISIGPCIDLCVIHVCEWLRQTWESAYWRSTMSVTQRKRRETVTRMWLHNRMDLGSWNFIAWKTTPHGKMIFCGRMIFFFLANWANQTVNRLHFFVHGVYVHHLLGQLHKKTLKNWKVMNWRSH